MPKRKATSSTSNQTSKKQKDEYDWKQLSQDLLDKNYIGKYGGCNSAWHSLAAIRSNVDLTKYHGKRSPDEFFLEQLDTHITNPHTQRRWGQIVS